MPSRSHLPSYYHLCANINMSNLYNNFNLSYLSNVLTKYNLSAHPSLSNLSNVPTNYN